MFAIVILFLGFALASPPVWVGSGINYYIDEDVSYYHNLSANITGFANDVTFAIDTESNINWTNASGTNSVASSVVSSWIKILNSSNGNLSINATHDNQTGFFVIPIQATNTTDEEGSITNFEFVVNATNDAPNFINIESEYNLTQGANFLNYTNASDEEEQYPLHFNISFFNNCTHAGWSSRTNCSLFDLIDVTNTSAIMNFTPTTNDVGTYWANITVNDYGENYSCPHAYCDNSTYMQNKSTSQIVQFNVLSSLTINVTNCTGMIFQENESSVCTISIRTKGETDSINSSSVADLRNYAGSISNTSWFYAENNSVSTNFTKTFYVNVTPEKTEIGNWTINFTVIDSTEGEVSSELIYVYVNRTSNDIPDLTDIDNTNTSIDLETTISLTVYDDDLLIPDKDDFNETTSFDVTILNQSNLSQELSLTGFDVDILSMPVTGTNRTSARIQFTPNSSEIGNYTINITVNDVDNTLDSDLFNLSIFDNNFPVWNQTEYSFDLIVNSSLATTAAFGPVNLTGDGYVTDTGDTLTFANDSNAHPGFSMTSAGYISFTPYKQDVGSWNFIVTATDSLGLQNQTTFRFNITNVNSEPVILSPITPINATVDVNSNINATEDNYTTLTLYLQDEDFRIASSKKDYYNESISFNLTIEGNNPNLFSFTKNSGFPLPGNNQSLYTATFTPNASDVGGYNITINVTDESNAGDVLQFNLTIFSASDAPILTPLSNYTTAVNRNFYLDMNATDEEDGNDSTGNLTYAYAFNNGTDFFNSTNFNSTTGVINITFNSTQAGSFSINITVNDTTNEIDTDSFWIYVYDAPNVTYPATGNNFALQENSTTNLTFTANNSVGTNLTYEFYINNSLKYNLSYHGNATNLTWSFTPNFSDETYGNNYNLTLVSYPTDSNLENRTEVNTTTNWDVNISHANAPVVFSGYIGDKQAAYTSTIEIDLSSYFSDVDYNDAAYNQSINFSVASNSSSSYISSSVSSDWTLTLSSLIPISEVLNVTGNDSSTNATSNYFNVEFTTPSTVTVTTPTSGGGGTTTIPVSLKIIMPNPVSAYQQDRIVLPLTLYNNGQRTLSGISLSSLIAKDNVLRDDLVISFDEDYFTSLAVGEKKNITMTVDIDTTEVGTFELTVNADVDNPDYSDWGKLYLTIKESNSSLLEKLIFTQEFLQENPECIELEELLDEARMFFAKGDFLSTIVKIQEAINGCKNAISQEARAKRREPTENKLYRYLLIVSIIVFFLGLGYYSYKRMKLRRGSGEYFVKTNDNKNIFRETSALVSAGAGLSMLLLANKSIVGFTINNAITENKAGGIWILIVFLILIGAFMVLSKRKKELKKIQKIKYLRNRNGKF
jgi:hypothetical protein